MVDATLPQERCDFYVYVIFRSTGEPCYVGKGKGGRWQQHIKKSHNRRLARIYANAGGDLPIVKVRVGLTNSEACATEIAFISALGRLDLDTGGLVNLTAGGEGAPGWKATDETRAKMAAVRRGKKRTGETLARIRAVLLERNALMKGKSHSAEHKARIAAAGVGRQPTQETRNKLSKANRGKKKGPLTPEHKGKISLFQAGRKKSDETKAKMADASRRSMADPERRAKSILGAAAARAKKPISDYAIKMMAIPARGSPEHIAKIVAFHKGRKRSPETCEKIGAAHRGKKLTDEHRAKLSAARRGVPKSEAHKEKMRLRMLGERNPMHRSNAPDESESVTVAAPRARNHNRKASHESDDKQLCFFWKYG